jgi:hypothetical protein
MFFKLDVKNWDFLSQWGSDPFLSGKPAGEKRIFFWPKIELILHLRKSSQNGY